MHKVLTSRKPARQEPASAPNTPTGPQVSSELGRQLDRLQTEEQIERDRQREEELARLRDLARHD